MDQKHLLDRRRVLARSCAVALGLLVPRSALAASRAAAAPPRPLPKRIDLVSTLTDEKVSVVYWDGTRYDVDALHEVDRVLRDHRTGEVRPIDPRLVDLLHDLRRVFRTRQPYQVLSGYRSPETNAWLRTQDRRVARHSYHLDGKAVDVRLPGVDPGVLLRAALHLGRGGTGYYPHRGFVHLDTGPLRAW